MKEIVLDSLLVSLIKNLVGLIPLPERFIFLKGWLYLLAVLLLAWVVFLLVRVVAVKVFSMIAHRTTNQWDDKLLARRVVHRLCHLAPVLVLLNVGGGLLLEYPSLLGMLVALTNVYLVMILARTADALLLSGYDIYQTYPIAKERPIRPFVQLLQIVVYFFAAIVAVALLLGKDPSKMILSLGAMAAVLMLIFQDIILGLVASIQASSTHMVKPGDWIEMPSRNADGVVLEILLNTVKVRNWDLSITNFPTFALMKESFKNYKGLDELGCRQISRAILLDVESVRFVEREELEERVRQFPSLQEYEKSLALDQPAAPGGPSRMTTVTNLALFRHYALYYLQARPEIVPDMLTTVRLLAPTSKGLPLQLYTFLKYTDMLTFDRIQSDIFEHLYAALPYFGLRMYQDIQTPKPQ